MQLEGTLLTFTGSTFAYIKGAYQSHTKGIQDEYRVFDSAKELTVAALV